MQHYHSISTHIGLSINDHVNQHDSKMCMNLNYANIAHYKIPTDLQPLSAVHDHGAEMVTYQRNEEYVWP